MVSCKPLRGKGKGKKKTTLIIVFPDGKELESSFLLQKQAENINNKNGEVYIVFSSQLRTEVTIYNFNQPNAE